MTIKRELILTFYKINNDDKQLSDMRWTDGHSDGQSDL